MDERRFDAALRALQAGTTRRKGLAGMLAVLLGGASIDAVAKGTMRAAGRDSDPETAGPCGDGTARSNTCRKSSECCTGYCANGACRCKPNYMKCATGAECCSGRCRGGRCDGGARPAGAACEENFNCQDGLACIRRVCAASRKARCTGLNCPGCCDGTVCRAGSETRACGANGKPCNRCRTGLPCKKGVCGSGCSAATCPNGCCKNGVCKPGASTGACGKSGGVCAACTGKQTCQAGRCKNSGGCTSNSQCTGTSDTCTSGSCKCGGGPLCSGATPVCSAGACVACASHDDCSGATPYCSNGTCVTCLADSDCSGSTSLCCSGACAAPAWSSPGTFGSRGQNADQFRSDLAVGLLPDGKTAPIADYVDNKIKFWTRPDTTSTTWSYAAAFGSYNTDPMQGFMSPIDLRVSADGQTIVVANNQSYSISVLSYAGPGVADWTFQSAFGSLGTNPDQLGIIDSIGINADATTVVVSDVTSGRISMWTRTAASSTTWTHRVNFGSYSQFQLGAVALSPDGLTALAGNNGSFVDVWTRPDTTSTTWTNQDTFGASGSGPGQFSTIDRITFSPDGLRAFASDPANTVVSVWTRDTASDAAFTYQAALSPSTGCGTIAVTADNASALVSSSVGTVINVQMWGTGCPV